MENIYADKTRDLIVGIDASRNRSGGAIAHVKGIISEGNPLSHGIREVHIWGYKSLLDMLPDKGWLIKHNPPALERKLASQLLWQFKTLAKEAKEANCDILFSTDAATLCRFRPMVVMSQDMLSYEPGIMKYFGLSAARARLVAILMIQNAAMKFADGVIFLTRYASDVIQKSTGKLHSVAIIAHGVDPAFKEKKGEKLWPNDTPVKCLYVSNAAMYKHQWTVVQAIAALRKRGCEVQLILVGGGKGRAQKLLDAEITKADPKKLFIESIGFVSHDHLPELMANADLFVFASSCENLPITLLEAMAVGLPIACSKRGPMPEVLKDGGVYFDPEDAGSIADAITMIINDIKLRHSIAKKATELAFNYSWSKCANETWAFLSKTAVKHD